jgi:imidazolonepropionase-like amidohydrolase
MKTLKLILVLLFVSSVVFAQPKEIKQIPSYIVLQNATIIDAISDEGNPGTILIKDDKIQSINYNNTLEIPEGAITYDLTGKFIIPGLIDGHVHITHGTEQDAKDHLKTALQHGVTGVRDMGGDGRMLGLLKKNMQMGENVGPDIFFGTIIAGPKFFENDPRPQSVALGAVAGEVSWQRAITHDTDFKQIVAEAKGIGSTAIKIYANVEPDLIKKVSDEAKKQGLKVWSHAAMAPSKPMDVIMGGSECVSHAGDIFQYEMVDELKDRHDFKSREEAIKYRKNLLNSKWDEKSPKVKRLLKKMKENNTVLDATLFVYTVGLTKNSKTGKVDSSRYNVAMKSTRIAYDAGIKILAGSDHMIDVKPYSFSINIHRELELLAEAGLSNIDIIRAATIINAEVVGEEKNIGTIEEGKLANLVILNSNPLDNISNTRDIKHVFKRGLLIQ